MENKQERRLRFEIVISKNAFISGEIITATVILTNISEDSIMVNKRLAINPGSMADNYWEVRFEITYPPGPHDEIYSMINRRKAAIRDFRQINPGEQVSRGIILSDYYALTLPGDYIVRAIYRNLNNGNQFNISAWTGELVSKPSFFKITERD